MTSRPMPKKPAKTAAANGVRPVRLRLAPAADHDVELSIAGGACAWRVKPLTSGLMQAATIEASRAIVQLYAGVAAIERVGGKASDGGLPDAEDRAGREGLYQEMLLAALARRAVIGWDDRMVDPGGVPIPFTLEMLGLAMRIPEVAEAFDRAYCGPLHERGAEKNGSRPSPDGISGKGRNGAAAAATTSQSAETNTGAAAPSAPTSNTSP